MKVLTSRTCLAAIAATLGAHQAAAQVAPVPPQSATLAPPAATAPPPQDGLADIVVTAQRRSESLQKTAIAIDVVQATALTRAGVTGTTQLTSLLPSVQIGSSGPSPSIFLRGVGSYSSTAGQSPAVPFYIDGVYVGRSPSVPSEFYDVDRLELLKGPQGTLYGRNASGGAFNILTTRPRLGHLEGRGSVEIGNYGDQTFEAALNVPIGDKIAIRASTQIVDKQGYSSTGYGDDIHQSGRIKALWVPSSNFNLLVNGSYGHVGGRGPAEVSLNKNVRGWYPWLDITDPRVGPLYASAPVNAVFGPGTVVQPAPSDGFLNLHFYNISAEANWNLGPVQITFEPAYRHASMIYAQPAPFLSSFGTAFGDHPERPETSKQTSIELRATSTNSSRLKYVAGLYFYNEDQYQQFHVFSGTIQNVDVTASYGTRSYAAFGQATYSLSDRFRVTGGLRYTSDRRSIGDGQFIYLQPSLLAPTSSCFGPIVLNNATECIADQYAGTKTFKNVSWKGGVEFDASRDILVYANVSRGFKAGGFNTQSLASQPGSATVVGEAQSFQPETLTSYEAGIKSRFLNNKLQINVEGYYWDYANHQEPRLSATDTGALNLVYLNAGKSRIYGFDTTILARPWHGGTINASVSYANSRYDDFVDRVPTAFANPAGTACRSSLDPAAPGYTLIDCSGFPIARTPKWTGGAGISQSMPVGTAQLVVASDFTYASSRFLSTEFVPIEKANPYAIINASATLNLAGGKWALTGFVRNINNGRAYTFNYVNSFAGIYSANIGSPRTYGARMDFHF